MMRFTCCLGASALLALFASVTVYAQDAHVHDQPAALNCGSTWMNEVSDSEMLANTARLKPDVYRRIVADNKRSLPTTLSVAEDIEWDFKVSNRVTNTFDIITAVLVWEGGKALIWVDKNELNGVRKNTIAKFLPQLERALDTASASTSRNPNQGILQNDEDVFGKPPTRFIATWGERTNFLLTDIKDAVAGGFVGGYFSPTDQFLTTERPASNEMNLLYIDSNEGISGGSSIVSLLSTIAHEYQHLIHHGVNKNSETVFNEGCSEVASILNGYMDRNNGNYLSNTNLDMFRWSYDDGTALLVDYSRAMTLVHYLTEQFGEGFLRRFLEAQTQGMDRIGTALTAMGRNPDWKEAMKGYSVANYLQTAGPLDIYKYRTYLKGGTAKIASTYTGSNVFSSQSITVQPYGTTYLMFNKPEGALKFKFSGDRDFSVMAMSYRGSEIIVNELEHNKDQYLGEWGTYDKVVLAITNLAPGAQTLQAEAQHIVLGVDDESTGIAGLSLIGTIPNPAQGAAAISFAVPTSGAVTLSIYNTRGELVSTLVDGEQMERGEHRVAFGAEELGNGYYIARLTQGDRTVSSPIVIVK